MARELSKDKNVLWSWSVESPSAAASVSGLDYDSAIAAWNAFRERVVDVKLGEMMDQVSKNFGMTVNYHGAYKIWTSAMMPTTVVSGVHWCPRRNEGGPGPGIAKDGDTWEQFPNGQRVCSYCGSLHPDDMLALLNEHGLSCIDPSTKGYKWYLSEVCRATNASLGPIKYYRMHDTEALVAKVEELISQAGESE